MSPAGTAPSSKKRKAETTTLDEDIAAYKQDLDGVIDPSEFEDLPKPSCGSVGGRINKLIDWGIMSKAEFCRAIGASSSSLNSCLQKTGPYGGNGSCVRYNAFAWFKQREKAGLKMPDVKKRQIIEEEKEVAAAASGSGSQGAVATSKKTTTAAASLLDTIRSVHLDGEETDNVPVYDTCDEIRKKISAHLKSTPGLTATQFCRDLYAQLHIPESNSIATRVLSKFRGNKGSNHGATSIVFYAAYFYFEKLRIAQCKPKSAHREGMEEVWGYRGMCREVDEHTNFICGANSRPHADETGMVRFS